MSSRVAITTSFVTLVLNLTVSLPSAFGDVPSPAERAGAADVKGLIAQLGDPKFGVRKSAAEKLAKIGLPAYQALEDATRDSDREIRYRAEKILSVIRQNDLNRRLTIFLASLESPEDRTLPSWTRFKAAFGNTSVTRGLFVEMQRAEGELLAQLETDPRQATELLGKRALALAQEQNRLNREGGSLPSGQVTATFFVAGEPDVKPSANTVALLLQLGTQPALRTAVLSGNAADKQAAEKTAMTRKLLGTVIARAEDVATQQAVQLAAIYDLKEGLAPALKMLEGPGRVRFTIQQAMLLVVKYGNDSHLPTLEKLFTDNTLLSTTSSRGLRREVQVRDSALAAAVLMTKQELKDYFELPDNLPAQQGGRGASNFSTAYLAAGFENDEKRAAAMKKWEAFKAKPPEPKK
ncbi:MAG: hypothetical protein K8R36_19130 [Planctomycetales bacterium]|nr:hypothetical protein [Planctomycetales bacterium]